MNALKKQSTAWIVTIVLIVLAIVIGLVRSHAGAGAGAGAGPGGSGADSLYYVSDQANVLSSSTEQKLSQRNQDMRDRYDAVVAVATVNYGRDDLGSYALDLGEDFGLSGYDFIVVLDISGENYWLVQGAEIIDLFTDEDCSNYAKDYMESAFARGDYDKAVLNPMPFT